MVNKTETKVTKREYIIITTKVAPWHLFSIAKFYRELDNDEETRKYYRYMSSRNAFEFIRNVFKLAYYLTLNNVLWKLLK